MLSQSILGGTLKIKTNKNVKYFLLSISKGKFLYQCDFWAKIDIHTDNLYM